MVYFCCEHADGRIRIFGEGEGVLQKRDTGAGLLQLADGLIEPTEALA